MTDEYQSLRSAASVAQRTGAVLRLIRHRRGTTAALTERGHR